MPWIQPTFRPMLHLKSPKSRWNTKTSSLRRCRARSPVSATTVRCLGCTTRQAASPALLSSNRFRSKARSLGQRWERQRLDASALWPSACFVCFPCGPLKGSEQGIHWVRVFGMYITNMSTMEHQVSLVSYYLDSVTLMEKIRLGASNCWHHFRTWVCIFTFLLRHGVVIHEDHWLSPGHEIKEIPNHAGN